MSYCIRRGVPADRTEIAKTITEAFYPYFEPFCPSIHKVEDAFASALHPERFMVAENEETGLVVGTAGLADGSGYPIDLKVQEIRKAVGPWKGWLAAWLMKDELYRPKTFRKGQCYISYVSVRGSDRGHGLAKRIIKEVLKIEKYRVFTLDVVQGNERVLSLYESLGFRTTETVKEKNGRFKGFTHRYWMEYKPLARAEGRND